MNYKFLLSIFIFFAPLTESFIQAEIVEIENIEEIKSYIIQKDTLVLFDIDETLIMNSTSIGTSQWRAWVKNKLIPHQKEFALYDGLTLHIAKNISYKAVQPNTALFITDLQSNGTAVFAFTARGRSEWYTSNISDVDLFTHRQLKNVGIDFKNTLLPYELEQIEKTYFHEGIIFSQHIPKGDLLKKLFNDLKYFPPLVIFVDDKLDQVKSVDSALEEMGIPSFSFWYRHAEIEGKNFNESVANIQLEYLLLAGAIVSDSEAAEMVKATPSNNPEKELNRILSEFDLNLLIPVLP